MPQPSDLTTLQNLKQWIQGSGVDAAWPSTAFDAQFGIYITAASRAALSYLQRPTILSRTVSELRDGTRTGTLVLREFPVTSISALYIGNLLVPARPSLSATSAVSSSPYGPVGYVLEPWDGAPPGKPQKLQVDGYAFSAGHSNVSINYTAGYAVLGEVAVVPSTTPFIVSPLAPYGRFALDISVAYASGAPLTKVSGTPIAGQYAAPAAPPSTSSAPTYNPVYTFAAADAGAMVQLSYSFVPYDLEQAVSKWIGEWWSYRLRVGEKSRAMPGGMGTATYDLSAMPDDVKMMLQPYRKAIPL